MANNKQAFQYVLIWNPTEQQVKDGQVSKLITENPVTILAKDIQDAQKKAVRAIPAEYEESIDQVDIGLRPF